MSYMLSEVKQPALGGYSTVKSLEDQNRCRDHRCPPAALVADGALRDVGRAHDLVRKPIDLFLFVPGPVGIELDVQSRRQHLGGKLLSVVTSHVVGLTKGMMLAQIPIRATVGRDSQSNRGGRQAVWLARGILSHHGERDLSRP